MDYIPNTPLCSKAAKYFCYLIQKIVWFFPKKPPPPLKPTSFLLCSQAHLGDLWLASLAIIPIKKRYPNATIGLVVSSLGATLASFLLHIDHIHVIPYWKKKNTFFSFLSLLKQIVWVFPSKIREICRYRYDCSVDLYPFFLNSSLLTYFCHIPHRLSMASGGLEFLMTATSPFSSASYLPCLYPSLLALLDIPCTKREIPIIPIPPRQELPNSYVVFHMGSSDKRKLWDSASWLFLYTKIKEQGFTPIFTGQGTLDKELYEEIGKPGISLINSLSIPEFIYVLSHAQKVLCVDSFALHIACQYTIPCVGIFLYNENVELWIPDTERVICFLSPNCPLTHPRSSTIHYSPSITPEYVWNAIKP